jgi:uncharacterized protein YegJ (DUF2314 family)
LNLKRDASFVVASESIEDWMINSGGTAFGGFSLRVIRSRLGEKEQMKFDAHTGIREFKKLMPCPKAEVDRRESAASQFPSP